MFDRHIIELKQELNQILVSPEQDAVSAFTIGTYDADKQQFPITVTVNDESFVIPVAQQGAREFKKVSSSLRAQGKKRLIVDSIYEYYNWTLRFDEKIIPFGPQKNQYQYVALSSQPAHLLNLLQQSYFRSHPAI